MAVGHRGHRDISNCLAPASRESHLGGHPPATEKRPGGHCEEQIYDRVENRAFDRKASGEHAVTARLELQGYFTLVVAQL